MFHSHDSKDMNSGKSFYLADVKSFVLTEDLLSTSLTNSTRS